MTDKNETENEEQQAARANELVRREFAGVTMAHENAATQSLIAKQTADVQSRWIMAMKRPRNLFNVRQMMIEECKRPGFAKVAMYAVPRGGSMITGLSIRFAEVAMRVMTNMSCEAQTLYDSDEERVVRVTASDFETNVTWNRDITVKKTVERKQLKPGQRAIRDRVNSYGDRIFVVEATDDDVHTKESAAISKASRTAILRLIPGHIQDEMKELIKAVAVDKAAKNPDEEKHAMFDAFAKLNVMPNDLAEWLGNSVDKITPGQIVELQMLYRAIRDNEMNWAEAKEHASTLRARAKTSATQAAKPVAANGAAAAAVPPVTVAPAPDKPKSAGKGTASVKDKIKEAKAEQPKQPAEESKPSAAAPIAIVPPPVQSAPAPSDASDLEDRSCALCGNIIEVPKADPPGAICYACSQG